MEYSSCRNQTSSYIDTWQSGVSKSGKININILLLLDATDTIFFLQTLSRAHNFL